MASFRAKFQTPGDYLTLEMFGWPLFLITDKDGNIVSGLPLPQLLLMLT